MKTLLIFFIVLLFLLTLLSSFGGSIRPKEPFYDDVPAYTPSGFDVQGATQGPVNYESPDAEPMTEAMNIVEKFEVPEPFTHDNHSAPWS